MSSDKKRIDTLIVEKGLCESREKAKRIIMAGQVKIGNTVVDKPGTKVCADSVIEIKEKEKYVSRGGYKLEKALEVFSISLKGLTCMDIGASTGGFTDCMLQNGAEKVYAVDVGYGQLDWKIRNDDRVIVFERTNFRKIDSSLIKEKIDFFTVDVSFISLKLIFPNINVAAEENAQVVTLIKPQFEAGKDKVENGIIKNINTHYEVLENVVKYANSCGFFLKNITFSPVKGTKGNIEYLAYFVKETGEIAEQNIISLTDIADNAFKTLNN